jgi:hypothetical protein
MGWLSFTYGSMQFSKVKSFPGHSIKYKPRIPIQLFFCFGRDGQKKLISNVLDNSQGMGAASGNFLLILIWHVSAAQNIGTFSEVRQAKRER